MKTSLFVALLFLSLPSAIAGIKEKIAAEIDSVNESIHQLKKNISISERNIIVVKEEIQSLSALEQEHNTTKEQFKNYISETNKKKSEKDKELKEAIAEEKTLKAKVGNNKTPADEEALKQAKEKRTQLELWIKEAEVKLKKVQLSLAELNKGINQSQIRRQKAEEEIETIRKNEAEFEKLLAQYTQRKATLEKLAKKSQQ